MRTSRMTSPRINLWGVRALAAAGIAVWAVALWPCCTANADDGPPAALDRWLVTQSWQRDTDGPVIALGRRGEFDDTHVFAPCVARERGQYALWYCGSRGTVAERVFRLGRATSLDGRDFRKSPGNPVFEFGDGKHSVLTPALLRSDDGSVLREGGKLRMWFSATHFASPSGLHTLHETTSTDGLRWETPSPPQLEHAYAPTVIKEDGVYRLWYTDVSAEPWTIRHATSSDGKQWRVSPEPVLVIDQPWEQGRLFYPAVLKAGGVYLMWYGSYWSEHANKTAIGFAASTDGLTWHKNPHNPVLRPDPARSWESHYTTSQSVLRLEDGSFRIWYASRTKPPFRNKYFAINTARWGTPPD